MSVLVERTVLVRDCVGDIGRYMVCAVVSVAGGWASEMCNGFGRRKIGCLLAAGDDGSDEIDTAPAPSLSSVPIATLRKVDARLTPGEDKIV
jgi:hypothetical protein